MLSNTVNLKDQAPLMAPGLYVNASEIDIRFGKQIDFLVNKESIHLCDHKDPARLAGCCGSGNLNVLNQICPNCSAEIGVIIEDCWLPHFIGISGGAVSKEKLW